ncbi:delta-aminolevulinic acid dehydratase [Winogradskyella sp. UBA3174]|uniref:delta-aminolevulinic acid dehydratase n=1 Tax=Winogradskyella sp. UBA3174 TaxID=1947785 RepID=UPI0025E2032B|nr:delta-aminolevulinic acid dehydratase [Winogradskyella sp. UBA3174]|tara:strand:+ start:52150 stop:53352 length:1203 start_codon:yes stop_codon:yes gene_type:complete
MSKTSNSFIKLKAYCEAENFKGWDPYDAMNSKVFQALPFKHWDVARWAWIQGFKKSPVNFRKLLLVPKGHNSKGVGLLLLGYCKLYKVAEKGNENFGSKENILEHINTLTQLLLDMQSEGYSGACWGYNFDWQARRLFLFKKNTPTVVATCFCVEALIESYEITKDAFVLKIALSAADFVMNDLSRTPCKDGFLFSYSVNDGNNTVINASLLGAKILSYSYKYTKNKSHFEASKKAVTAACQLQEEDGSWIYGLLKIQSWKDSFHTGFNLDAIETYQKNTEDDSFQKYIDKGWSYYIDNFFEANGMPKYYHNKTYPIDIHCPGQVMVTASKLNVFNNHKVLFSKVLNWTVDNMQHKNGYFYYQLKRGVSSKISYMRWSNAFMFNAMAHYFFESENAEDEI